MITRPRLVLLGLLVVMLGCGDSPVGPTEAAPSFPDVRSYVAGEALEALDQAGHFRMPTPTVEGPYPVLPPDLAQEIAEGVVRTWIVNPDVVSIPGLEGFRETVERNRGAPVDWDEIQVGPRAPLFAESHLEPLPTTVGNPTIRFFGPWYLTTFYVGPTPVMVIAVAGYATNVFLDAKGFVRRTDRFDQGGEFWTAGVPEALGETSMPPAPEVAVEFAFLETGRKVIEVPALGTPGNRIAAPSSRWRLKLSDTVRMERLVDGEEVVTDEVFVGVFGTAADVRLDPGMADDGPGLRLYVAAPEQPEAEDLGPITARVRDGYAVDLHEVRVVSH